MKKFKIMIPFIFVTTLVIDQLSKMLVDSKMFLGESIQIIPGFFNITYTRNTGAAWSILEGKMIFFYLIAIVAIIILILFYRSLDRNDYFTKVAIVLIISGTMGNLIDRITLQYVRDFFDFIIFGYDFPIFNVADSCLVIGIIMIILNEIIDDLGVRKYGK